MVDEPVNLTVEVLREIRDEVRRTNDRLDTPHARLDHLADELGSRIDGTNDRLERVETRLERVDTGLNDLGKFMRQIALDQANHERFHFHHVEKLEEDVRDLKTRVTKLESG